MTELQAQYDDDQREEGGLFLGIVVFVLGMIALVQGIFSRKHTIWHKVVSRKDGFAYIQKKAKNTG